MKKQVGPDGKEYVLLEADVLEKLQQQIQQSSPSQPQIIIVNQASANADVDQENQAREDGCLEQLGGLLFLGLIIYACFAFGWC